ncbi:hypothetical protein J6590_070610 [Homalodisca vitripennis]|nr:hypothetical protein J6590_070610 [Homalodisca vitripennis]
MRISLIALSPEPLHCFRSNRIFRMDYVGGTSGRDHEEGYPALPRSCYLQVNRIKQRQTWLLLGWVTAERSCPCKQSAFPADGDGSEVTFKQLVPRFSAREGFLTLT